MNFLDGPRELAPLAESDVVQQVALLLGLVADLRVVPVVQQRLYLALDFLLAALQETVVVDVVVLHHELLGLADPGDVLLVDGPEVRVGDAVGGGHQNGQVDLVLVSDLLEVVGDEEALELLLEEPVVRSELLEVVLEHLEDLLEDELVLLLGPQRLGHLLVQDVLQVLGQRERVELLREDDAELPLDDCPENLVLGPADEAVFVVQLLVIEELHEQAAEVVAGLSLVALDRGVLLCGDLGDSPEVQRGLLVVLVDQLAELLGLTLLVLNYAGFVARVLSLEKDLVLALAL